MYVWPALKTAEFFAYVSLLNFHSSCSHVHMLSGFDFTVVRSFAYVVFCRYLNPAFSVLRRGSRGVAQNSAYANTLSHTHSGVI
jgi:hypothetical protein